MSEVFERYYQKCDMCGKTVEIRSKKEPLNIVKVPMDYYEEDGRRKLTVSQFSMCADCLVEMREYLRGKYVMYEQEYSGVVVRKKGEQE